MLPWLGIDGIVTLLADNGPEEMPPNSCHIALFLPCPAPLCTHESGIYKVVLFHVTSYLIVAAIIQTASVCKI